MVNSVCYHLKIDHISVYNNLVRYSDLYFVSQQLNS